MATAVLMPELGESVDEATITQWLKRVGDSVQEFEPLLEVNTDKVDTEIPSPASGTLLKILASADQVVHAGMTLAWIGEPGEDTPGDGEAAQEQSQIQQDAPAEEFASVPEAAPVEARSWRPGRDPELGYISPVVARMASEHNLDLSRVQGTGMDGRITKLDVQAYLEKAPAPAQAPGVEPLKTPSPKPAAPEEALKAASPKPAAPEEALKAASPKPAPPEEALKAASPKPAPIPGEVVKLTTIRRMIADHMVMSKRTSPHVTTVMEADMSKVVAHRIVNKAVFARDGARLTYTAYFISAIAFALRRHPMANSSWGEDGIHLHRDIHIGMATALETDGLIVPVIRHADELSLLGLARKINDLASRARQKELQPDEVRGGTFTLTNHGTSGSLFATPIINQPQCGILGVGAMQKRVVVINDAIAIRPMVYISFTFDHRILDGASADYFLAEVKSRLEGWEG